MNVIGSDSYEPVQLELFKRTIHPIQNPTFQLDAIRGTEAALDQLRMDENLQTIVLVAYCADKERGWIEVYSNGIQPTVERTVWILHRGICKMDEFVGSKGKR